MKKIFITSLILLQAAVVFAYDRFDFDKEQRRQENMVQLAYNNGRVTENEYLKLMHEQEIIKESITLADLDHHWSLLEINTVKNKLQRAAKRLRKYERNTERF